MDAIKSLEESRRCKLVGLERLVKQLKKQVDPSFPTINELRRLEEIISCVKLGRRNIKREEYKNKHSWSNIFPFRQFVRLGVIPSRTIAAAAVVEQTTSRSETNEVDIRDIMPDLKKILIEELPHHSDPSKKEMHLHVRDSNVESMIEMISSLNSKSPLQPTTIYVSFTGGNVDCNNLESEEDIGTEAAVKFAALMLSFNQFENSLESLSMDLRRLNARPNLKFWVSCKEAKDIHFQGESWILDITLSNLKNLSITDCRGPWGFLLCFPALENLNLLECSIGCFHNEKVVQLTWEEEAMYESSIWKCLPKLQTLRMERVKDDRYPERWFPELNLELTRESYDRFQREKHLKMTTIVWDVRKKGSGGGNGRRWWRYRKYW